MPSGTVLSNNRWGKEGGRAGCSQSDAVCLPKELLHMMSPAFLELAELLPADGK